MDGLRPLIPSKILPIRPRRCFLQGLTTLAVLLLVGCVTTTSTEPVLGSLPDSPAPTLAIPNLATVASWMKSEQMIPATEMATVWMNRIAYLPDPTRNGQMGPGLAGQLILLGPGLKFAPANGTLTVDVYDETPRTPGVGPPALLPERWQFHKADLAKLLTNDERFGKSYTIFLPWVNYRPDVTRVKIMARYDPDDGGHPLFAPSSALTLDTTSPSGSPVWSGGASTVVPSVPPAGYPARLPSSPGGTQFTPQSALPAANLNRGMEQSPVPPFSR